MLRVLFIDFNAYFASVEQQLDASLRGEPVVVAPVMAESSCCIAVTNCFFHGFIVNKSNCKTAIESISCTCGVYYVGNGVSRNEF